MKNFFKRPGHQRKSSVVFTVFLMDPHHLLKPRHKLHPVVSLQEAHRVDSPLDHLILPLLCLKVHFFENN